MTDNILRRAWRAEPVAIVTIAGTILLAVVDAIASPEGWSWHSVSIAAIGALMGLVARENVYSPKTVDALASPESAARLDADPATAKVEPHGPVDVEERADDAGQAALNTIVTILVIVVLVLLILRLA